MSNELLPRQAEDFRKKEYWDSFFQKRGERAFEWYGEYASMRPALHALLALPDVPSLQRRLKANVRVLVVGCGNSALSAELAADGFSDLVSVDFSERVIDEMRRKHPALRWEVMDMTRMDAFAAGSFDLVLDKGALDALMAEDTPEIRADASRMLQEVQRVLAPGGRYCCVTMAQDFILSHLLEFFSCASDAAWAVGVQELPRDARKPFAPFLAAALKCPRDSKAPRTARYGAKEFQSSSGEARQRWLTHEVEATQWYAMTQAALRQLQVGRQEVVELIANDANDTTTSSSSAATGDTQVSPRFTLRLVDVSLRGPNGSCAVFLIPQGREHEWMFATEEGALELANGAGFSRLILVALGRGGHAFESTAQVQEELNAKVLELAPDTLRADEQIPYLTVEEGLGSRNVVHQGTSPLSGNFFIEEVEDAGERLRRLVFLSNTNVIQSEVKLLPPGAAAPTPAVSSTSTSSTTPSAAVDTSSLTPEEVAAAKKAKKRAKKKNQKKRKKAQAGGVVDTAYLAFEYHKGMVAALHAASLATRPSPLTPHRTLVLGLGGGCLAQYLHDNVPGMDVTACELDPSIVGVAEQFFGFTQGERMRVVVSDALQYVAQQAQLPVADAPRFDSIIVDVDAKQRDVGMSCPPVAFVEDVFLAHVHALLAPRGVLLLNVSCRERALYQDILTRLQRAFPGSRGALELKPSEQDVNSVVFIRKAAVNAQPEPQAKALLQELRDQGRRRGQARDAPAYVDDELCELMRDIQLSH